MLWSIDSCQNSVSADQYHMTVLRSQVSTHRGYVIFWRLSAHKFNNTFQLISRSTPSGFLCDGFKFIFGNKS